AAGGEMRTGPGGSGPAQRSREPGGPPRRPGARRLPPARHAGLGSARPAAAGDAGTESGLIQRRLLAQQPVEILSVAVLAAVAVGSGAQPLGADVALAPGDLLGRGDLEALPLLHRGDEVRRIQQAVRRAGIEPGEA